jgi:hypothetical protein
VTAAPARRAAAIIAASTIFCVGCTCLARVAAVDIDAIRALSSESNGHSNQPLPLFTGIAPLAMAALSNAQKAFITLRREAVVILQLARFFFVNHNGYISSTTNAIRVIPPNDL